MPQGTSVSSTWAALRQRKMVQWGLAYLAGAWVALQVIGLASQSYAWPPVIMRLSFGAAVLGLIATLVLAWYHGERGEQKISGTELLILAALLVVGGGVLWRTESLRSSSTAQDAANVAAHVSRISGPVSPKSIAVLPFENLSADKNNAYFAGGMRDEILTRLAGIHDLKVISRTSTQEYATRPQNLRLVAEQLGVATVLEGSVQKAGNQVHINVQLIDALTDDHLWAESYDRELRDIFEVQRDVAEKIATALKAQLLPEETVRVADVPTRDAEAYDLYLRAGAHFNRANEEDALVTKELPLAIALYQQVLAKDPDFALAAAALAKMHMYMYFLAPDRTQARLALAKAAAEQALVLQPGLGEGHYALGLFYYWGRRDYARALRQFLLARQALPNSVDVAMMLAAVARRRGQWDKAVAGFEQAVELDPRSVLPLYELALTYGMSRRYAEADRTFSRITAVAADAADAPITRAYLIVAWKGDLAPLRTALAALVPGSDAYRGDARTFFQLHWWSRDYAAAIHTAQAEGTASWNDLHNVALPRRLFLAWAYAAAGEEAKARAAYEAVREQMRAALVLRPDDADLHLALGFANAGLGFTDEAVREGRKAASLMPVSRDAHTGAGHLRWLAQLYVRVGDNDQALDLLKRLLAMPAGLVISPALLRLDPVWDPLRGDPRFQALLEKDVTVGRN